MLFLQKFNVQSLVEVFLQLQHFLIRHFIILSILQNSTIFQINSSQQSTDWHKLLHLTRISSLQISSLLCTLLYVCLAALCGEIKFICKKLPCYHAFQRRGWSPLPAHQGGCWNSQAYAPAPLLAAAVQEVGRSNILPPYHPTTSSEGGSCLPHSIWMRQQNHRVPASI